MTGCRILLEIGHGPGNGRGGRYDPGAQFARVGFDREHEMVRDLARQTRPLLAGIPSLIVPDEWGLDRTVAWINENAEPGDLLVSLHMNAGGGTGVETVVASIAPPERLNQGQIIADVMAECIGLRCRGVKKDTETPNGSRLKNGKPQGLAIVRDTVMPAFILEAGFIDNEEDVVKVRAHGPQGLAHAIRAVRRLG